MSNISPIGSISEQDKERIRYHTGYMETSFAASMQLGIPRPIQTIFLLEQSMNNLTSTFAITRVIRTLDILDETECRIERAQKQLLVSKLGDLTLRGAEEGMTATDLLEREYGRWARRLADILGIPLYPYSARFKRATGVYNVPVS